MQHELKYQEKILLTGTFADQKKQMYISHWQWTETDDFLKNCWVKKFFVFPCLKEKSDLSNST